MRAMMYRSIPLAIDTRNAWREAGCVFAKRESTPDRVAYIARGAPIINLGSSNMNILGIWNQADVIKPLLTPRASRNRFDEFLPANRWMGEGFYWLKGAGRGGANKEKFYVTSASALHELQLRANWMEGDVQHNIDGTEYRVITVGTKVVQVMERAGANGHRDYTWVGVSNAPTKVKEVARESARRLDNEKTIIGWDVIAGDEANGIYILEGNSCPGVNTATAGRILDAVEGIAYDAA